MGDAIPSSTTPDSADTDRQTEAIERLADATEQQNELLARLVDAVSYGGQGR